VTLDARQGCRRSPACVRNTALTHHRTGVHATFHGSRQEMLRLRFIEEWEYHKIAADKAIPIGTVQWLVFKAKKKLVPLLRRFDGALSRSP
jgi:hypothetical protein